MAGRKINPTPTPKEISDGLLEARALMNGKGGRHWIKGQLTTMRWFGLRTPKQEQCYCSAGAILAAAGPNKRLATAMLKQLASSIAGSRIMYRASAQTTIYGFNDSSNRVWVDVSRMFRQAAKEARLG